VLCEADLTIGNLECPLSTRGERADKQYTFRAHPDTAAALAEAGFDVMTLANNHVLDYGSEALLDTIETLRAEGILSTGAGRDLGEARRHVLLECGSPPVKVAVLAFSNMRPISFFAGPHQPGTNPALPEIVAESVGAARREAEVVIAVFHWGHELSSSPTAVQRRLAQTAVDAGADLVAGHHPHLLQGIEIRGHALIAYSLGNFLFPSRGACRWTLALRYTPAPDGGARVEFIPCVIDGFRPRPATEEERSRILDRLVDLSLVLDTDLSSARGTFQLPPRSSPAAPGAARPALLVDKADCAP
jgi:poly-gamma-glutamate synthesis protein (capsule biosynthesis protein)